MMLSDFLPNLLCPDCGGEPAGPVDRCRCQGCGRAFEWLDGGILSMLPTHARPLPAEYDDPDYKKMSALFDDASDYFTDGNSLFHSIHISSHRIIAEWMAARGGSGEGWVCDLGCGQGFHFPYYAGDPARLIGVDIRVESLQRYRAQTDAPILIQADFTKLPFKPAAFEAIFSIYALEHVYFLNEACVELARVLDPSGELFVGLPCEGGLAWNLGRKLTSERTMSKRYDLDYANYIRLEHCNTAARVDRALREHFQRRRKTLYPLPWLPLISTNLTLSCAYAPGDVPGDAPG